MLEVLSGGTLTTIQDGGRPDLGHLGVPRSGACDPDALAVANLLLGNPPDAAALELTLTGPVLRATVATTIGIGGADLGAVTDRGHRLLPGASYALDAGEILSFPGPVAGEPGFRGYLAVPGGIDVPIVLGSRSTCLVAGFGGLDGRAVAAGDIVRPSGGAAGAPPGRRWPRAEPASGRAGARVVRLLPGPADAGGALLNRLSAVTWTVSPASDRMGLRLDGVPVEAPGAGTILTHGVGWGAVQLPPDGRPIVLLADAQPTGGYPVAAVAIVADRPALGQARPGTALRFAPTTVATAREALVERDAALAAAARTLAEDATWDALVGDAGGWGDGV